MRHAPIVQVERYRVRSGYYGTTTETGNYGAFQIPCGKEMLRVVVSAGDEAEIPWEHVSVSLPNRCPTWQEMTFVKDLFFRDDETVIQFHPAKKDYVNCHPYCLHLWLWTGGRFPLPDPILVGPRVEEGTT